MSTPPLSHPPTSPLPHSLLTSTPPVSPTTHPQLLSAPCTAEATGARGCRPAARAHLPHPDMPPLARGPLHQWRGLHLCARGGAPEGAPPARVGRRTGGRGGAQPPPAAPASACLVSCLLTLRFAAPPAWRGDPKAAGGQLAHLCWCAGNGCPAASCPSLPFSPARCQLPLPALTPRPTRVACRRTQPRRWCRNPLPSPPRRAAPGPRGCAGGGTSEATAPRGTPVSSCMARRRPTMSVAGPRCRRVQGGMIDAGVGPWAVGWASGMRCWMPLRERAWQAAAAASLQRVAGARCPQLLLPPPTGAARAGSAAGRAPPRAAAGAAAGRSRRLERERVAL